MPRPGGGGASAPDKPETPASRQESLFFPPKLAPAPAGVATCPREGPVPSGATLVLDLETKLGFDQLRRRTQIRDMGVSVGVTYAYEDDRYRTYFEQDIPELLIDIFSASRIIGFNIRRFDYEVLRGYTRRALEKLPTVDLLDDVERALGHRVSLDNLLRNTLRTSKSGDGGRAIQWFQEGQWARLERYCIEDVRTTKALYEHGREEGFVRYWDRRRRAPREIPVSW